MFRLAALYSTLLLLALGCAGPRPKRDPLESVNGAAVGSDEPRTVRNVREPPVMNTRVRPPEALDAPASFWENAAGVPDG